MFVMVGLFVFQSVSEVLFELVSCTQVRGSSVLFIDGTVECFQAWQVMCILCLTVVILPFPLGLIALRKRLRGMRNAASDPTKRAHVIATLSILEGPYVARRAYWESVVYAFRLAIVIPHVFITDEWARTVVLACICTAQLLCSTLASPFVYRRQNFCDMFLRFTLVVVAVFSIRRLDSTGSSGIGEQRDAQAVIAFILPLACFVVAGAHHALAPVAKKRAWRCWLLSAEEHAELGDESAAESAETQAESAVMQRRIKELEDTLEEERAEFRAELAAR
jgi:hypothetical protein